MRILLAATAAASLILAAGPVSAAEGLFESFQRICVAHPHDKDAVVAAALADGFKPMEPAPATRPGPQYFERTVDQRQFGLVVEVDEYPAGAEGPAGVRVGCGVTADGEDKAAIAAARAWIAMPAAQEAGGLSFFFFREKGGARTPVSLEEGPAADALWSEVLLAGEMRTLRLQDSSVMTAIILDSSREFRE